MFIAVLCAIAQTGNRPDTPQQVNDETLVHPYCGTLFRNKREGTPNTHNYLNESLENYAE